MQARLRDMCLCVICLTQMHKRNALKMVSITFTVALTAPFDGIFASLHALVNFKINIANPYK